MRYLKKQISFSMAIMLILSLSLGSFVMAEGENNSAANPSVAPAANSCTSISVNRDHIVANNLNSFVDNGNGTITATFSTTENCVQVSVSTYVFPAGTIPNSFGTPYEDQIHYDGETNIYPIPGEYSVTLDIPVCAPYQADIYSGPEQIKLGSGGHGSTIKAWKLKRENNCPTPTPTTTPTTTPESTPTPTPTPETTTIVEIDDEEPPVGGIGEGQDGEPPIDTVIDVAEDQVPLDTLPKTGDSSPLPYYLIGAFTLTAGFLSLRKQRQRR